MHYLERRKQEAGRRKPCHQASMATVQPVLQQLNMGTLHHQIVPLAPQLYTTPFAVWMQPPSKEEQLPVDAKHLGARTTGQHSERF
ncbi:Telomerase Protein Component 1 [Manis pentadactyla]|nr:Telomerase Protein Component 1 [Manis pentadactyla]